MVLEAPDLETVCRWRAEAERPLRERNAPRAMGPRRLHRFMQHFERLSRHALRVLPAQADVRIRLDAIRQVRSMC